MTNGDRIRQMSNEELAKEFAYDSENKCLLCAYNLDHKCTGFNCEEGIKAYLESEEEECI